MIPAMIPVVIPAVIPAAVVHGDVDFSAGFDSK